MWNEKAGRKANRSVFCMVEKRCNANSNHCSITDLLSKIYMVIQTFALMLEQETLFPFRSCAIVDYPVADNTLGEVTSKSGTPKK